MSITVAIGVGVSDKHPTNRTFDTLEDFEAFVLRPPTPLAGITEEQRGSLRFKAAKTLLPYMVGGPTDERPEPGRGGWRGAGNFPRIEVMILDVDEADETLANEIRSGTGTLAGLRYVWHTTPSATAKAPKFRVYLPLAEPIPGARQADLYLAIKAAMDTDAAKVDEKSKGAAHIMFGPGAIAGGYFESGANRGENLLDGLGILAGLPETQEEEPRPQAETVRPSPASAPQGDALDEHWRGLMVAAGAVLVPSPRRPGLEETTQCPWHDDHNPSLDIKPNGEMVCRAGCVAQDGRNPSWLRYVAQVRGESLSDAARWARSIVGGSARIDGPGAELFEDLDADGAPEPKRNAYSGVPIAKLPDIELVPEDYFWGDWIARGCITSMIAAGGLGKSTLLRAWAKAMSDGDLFLGRTTRPFGGGRVMFLDFETSPGIRKKKIREVFGDDLDAYPDVLYAVDPPMISTAADVAELSAALAEAKPDAMVLDTTSAGLNIENENDSKDVLKWLNALRNLARRHNMAVVIVHHPGKAAVSTARGSTAWRNSVDVELMLKSASEGEMPEGGYPDDAVFVVHSTKCKIGRMGKVVFSRSNGGFVLEEDGTAAQDDNSFEAQRTRRRIVAECLRGQPEGVKLAAVQFALEGRPGCSRRAISNALKDMVADGIADKVGQVYRLNPGVS